MDDLVKRLRTYDEFEADDALLDEAADRIEALEAVLDAAHGLSFGEDWNTGNHATVHGYRKKLLVALAHAKGNDASPAAIRALMEKSND